MNSHVIVIGCGGLGSIVAPYLAGAGVGKITLIDADIPDITNLHRQVFFSESETGTKAQALANHIDELNPEIEVLIVETMLLKSNIDQVIQDCDLVLECTDDMMTKYLVNDFCHMNNIPMVYGAIYKFDGYVSLFKNIDEKSIHLRDVFPEPDTEVPSCSEVGVLNTIAGIIGLFQANEAIKFILGIGSHLNGTLLTYNALSNDQLKLKLKKNWSGKIQDVYSHESYASLNCLTTPELTYTQLMANPDRYNIVSVLEDNEHHSIHESTKRMPLSSFDFENWKPVDKPTVFYCMSGKRSAFVVDKILSLNSAAEVFSLKGGLGLINN